MWEQAHQDWLTPAVIQHGPPGIAFWLAYGPPADPSPLGCRW
jgi:hypothetical protein